MLLKTAGAVLALAGAGLASAQSRVVYDSRVTTPEPRITESERGRVKYLADQAMQAGLWGTGEFSRFEGCAGEDFQINGVAPGSFTVKGAQQTAYLYMYCYARTGWSQGLIITQGNAVVAHYVFIGMASTMYALKDINQNGFTELVLEGGFTGQGYTEGFLEIAELQPQRRLLGKLNYEFGQPYDDDCGVRSNGGVWSSRVIRVTPGPTPKFTQQLIQGRCGNFKVATSTGPVQPLKLTPAPTGWTPAPTR